MTSDELRRFNRDRLRRFGADLDREGARALVVIGVRTLDLRLFILAPEDMGRDMLVSFLEAALILLKEQSGPWNGGGNPQRNEP